MIVEVGEERQTHDSVDIADIAVKLSCDSHTTGHFFIYFFFFSQNFNFHLSWMLPLKEWGKEIRVTVTEE